MAFDWRISVKNPTLQDGMSFRVRYKKQPDGNWIDFLPNPTTNIFTISNLPEEKHIAEIKTICADGTISTPGYIENFCFDEIDDGTPPKVNIFWTDTQGVEEREYEYSYNFAIRFNATDEDNDIILIEGQTSNNNNDWVNIGVVENDFRVAGNKPNDYYYRVKVTDSKNQVAYSNVLSTKYKEKIDRVFQKYTKYRYSYQAHTEPKFYKEGTQELLKIRKGFKISIYIRFYRKRGFEETFTQEYIAQSNYNNIKDWFEAEVKDLGDWGRIHTYFGSNKQGIYGVGYGFNDDGSDFFVKSQRYGTASRDLQTTVKIEISN